MTSQKSKNAKTILYDGECSLCKIVIKRVNNSSQKTSFKPVDVHKSTLPTGITSEQVEKELHVVDSAGKIIKGGDAILAIVSEYPRWKWLATIGRLPGAAQAVRLGYKLVAANRHLAFGANRRLFWLKATLAIAMMSGLLLSTKLWTGQRSYPTAPLLEGLPTLPVNLGIIELVFMIIALALTAVSPNPRRYILAFLGLAAIVVLFDQSRLQPWFYQYSFMLGALIFFRWNNRLHQKSSRDAILAACMLIIASIYIYSGLLKMNPFFTTTPLPWMLEPLQYSMPDAVGALVRAFSKFLPLLEVIIGFGLLIVRTRMPAAIAAATMHLAILYCLGPFGLDWNSVVWPWNITMIILVTLLFWKSQDVSIQQILWTQRFLYQRLLLLLFGILPIFGYYGHWDSYLSASLYSGNTRNALVSQDVSTSKNSPAKFSIYAVESNGRYATDLGQWSYNEVNVPSYPEPRVYRQIFKKLCASSGANLRMDISGRYRGEAFDKPETYYCSSF